MHDPMTVAFQIHRPWPQRTHDMQGWSRWEIHGSHWRLAGRTYYWPSLATVWHVEPGGHDSGNVCKQYHTDSEGQTKILWTWKLHVHHWKIKIHLLQVLRRRLLTRCAWCNGRSTKKAVVNHSNQWNDSRGKWWKGDPNLFHQDCAVVERAAVACACERPMKDKRHGDVGTCQNCGLAYFFQSHEQWQVEQRRILQTVPRGQAPTREIIEATWAIWNRHKKEEGLL